VNISNDTTQLYGKIMFSIADYVAICIELAHPLNTLKLDIKLST
jgi:hypothetical protein